MDRTRSRSRCHRERKASASDGEAVEDDNSEWAASRPKYFANQVIRLAIKSVVAQRLGTDVFALLCVIALTEDARRYHGPVTFWNDQLLPLVGFAKRDRLARARKKAIAAGWLLYKEGGRHVPGKYRVTVPVELRDIVDCAVDEGPTPGNGWREGAQEGREAGGKRVSNRAATGATFLPVPIPAPDPLSVPGRMTMAVPKEKAGTKPYDWLPDWPQLREFAGITIPPTPQSEIPERLRGSTAFEPLSETDLRKDESLREWHRWQLTLAAPVLGPTEAHVRLMLATAWHVTKTPDDRIKKSRVAMFNHIISKQRWADVRERLSLVKPSP